MLRLTLVILMLLGLMLIAIGVWDIARQQGQLNRWGKGLERAPAAIVSRSFRPYLLTLAGLLPLGAAAGIAWQTGAWGGQPAPPGIDPGTAYYLIPPRHDWRSRRKAALVAAGVWQLAGVLAWGHFFVAADGPDLSDGPEAAGGVLVWQRDWLLAGGCTIAYIAIGLAPLAYAVYLQRIKGRITEPRVRATMGNHFFLGRPLELHIVDERSYGYTPEYARIGLRCRRAGRKEDAFSQWIDVTERWVAIGSLIDMPSFDIPADRPPSSSSCTWQVEMITKHKEGPRWRNVHPIRVELAGEVEEAMGGGGSGSRR